MRIQSRQTPSKQLVQNKRGNSKQRSITDDKLLSSIIVDSKLGRRLFAIEALEDRRLLAGTTPDVYELKSLSPTYDSSYFIESPRPVIATVGTDGKLTYDFRSDLPGDQTVDFSLGSDWSTRRFLVDPNQSYRLGFLNQIGEGGMGFEAFDAAGNHLGVYGLPFTSEPNNFVDDLGMDVAILGPSGKAFPTGTSSFQFTNIPIWTGVNSAVPGGLSFAFGFLTDKIQWIDSKVSVDRWHANDWVKVDTSLAYPISYYATLQNSSGQLHSLGYEASDADRLLIEAVHVQRYGNAADTRLASPLNPGDTVIQVQSTAGWAVNSLEPRNRSLVWYGYTDSQGTAYADFTYTRNVARDPVNGMWNPGGIVGNTINLRVPWSGPALAVGTAIRNAVDNESLFPDLQFQSPLLSSKTVTVSGLWQQGTPASDAFPPGTQFIRLAASTNLNSLSVDENVAIRMKIGADVPPQLANPAANRRSAVLDVMANDQLATQITSVTQPVYGSILITTGADGRTRLLYQSSEFQIGSDFFSYTVQLSDGGSATEQGFIKLLGGNLDSNPTLQTSIAQGLTAKHYQAYGTAAVKNQELVVDPSREHGLINSLGPAFVFVDSITTDTGASRIMPDGSYRFTPKPNSTESYFFHYDVRSGANERLRYFNKLAVYSSEFQRDQIRLRQIGIAEDSFESAYKQLFYNNGIPRDANGRPFLSWRVLMLPMLGNVAFTELYNKFKLDEPWNSANNLPLLDQMPDVFRSAGDGPTTTLTRYQVIANSAYPGSGRFFLNSVNAAGNNTRLAAVTDGLTNTILVVQTGADKAVLWTKPDDLPFNESDPLATLGNVGNYFNSVFADGQVRALPTDIGAAKFSALAQLNDGVYLDPATETRRAKLRADFPGDPIVYGEAYQASQIRKLALAFHNYESAFKRLPPAGVNLSWRVSILPYLEQTTLYNQFRFDEPWNSATNLALLDDMPDIFRALGDSPDTTDSSYRLLGGTQMAYASGLTLQGPRFAQFTDGLSNSIMFVEAGKYLSVPWTKPDVLVLPSADMWANLGTLPGVQMRVAMADSAVRSIWNGVSNDVILGLATINAGDGGWSSYELAIGDPSIGSRWELLNQLKQIALGVHNYESAFKFIPNDFFNSLSQLPTGNNGLSWRVAILPYIDEGGLFNQFHLNEPWDSPHNLSLLPLMPAVFKTGRDTPGNYTTRIQRFSGPGTMDPRQRLKFSSVTDGLSNTLLVAVTEPEKAVPWTKPDDIDYLGGEGWSSLGRDVQLLLAAIGDGSVQTIKRRDDYFERMDGFSFDNMVLRNDGRVSPVPVTRRVVLREDQTVEALWVAKTVGLFLDFDDPSLASVANAIQAGPGQNYQRITLAAIADRNGPRQTKLNVRVLSDPNNVNSPLNLIESIDVIVVDSDPNLQPTINQVSTVTIDEDAGLTTIPLTGITAGGSESQPLRVTATSNSSLTGPLTVNYVSPSDTGAISFTPGAEQSGNALITVTVEDGGPDQYLVTTADNQTRLMTFQLIVREANDAPLINSIPNVTVDEDAAQQTTSLSGIAAGGGETQPLRITASSSDTTLIANPLVIYTSANPTGQLRWTPLPNRFGQAVITVTVEDGGIDKNLSTTIDNASRQETFVVTVNPVNDIPLLNSIANATVLEDAAQQTTNLSGIAAGGGESQSLRITTSSSNSSLVADPTVVYTTPNSTGQLQWTPLPNQFGQTVITVTVEDGGLDNDLSTGTDNARAQRLFTITVSPINDQPLFDAIPNIQIDEDAGLQNTSVTGIEAGGGESQPLRVIAKSSNLSLIADPQVVYSSPGTNAELRWFSAPNQFGQAIITVLVEDGGADLNLDTPSDNLVTQRTYSITVNPVNDAPQVNPLPNLVFDEDALPQTASLTGIAAGGGESQQLRIAATSSNASLVAISQVIYSSPTSTGQLVYVPQVDQFGQSVITISIEDGGLDNDLSTTSDNATSQMQFTITVNPINDSPTIELPSNITIDEDSSLSLPFSGITVGGGESQPLRITAVSGNMALLGNPSVTYSWPDTFGHFDLSPQSDQFGQVIVLVTVEDGGLDGDLQTSLDNAKIQRFLTVTIRPVNDKPLVDTIGNESVDEDSLVQTTVLSGIAAGGGEAQPLKITATSSNAELLSSLQVTYQSPNTTGQVIWKPALDKFGTTIVTVTVEDGGLDQDLLTTQDNATTQQSFTITVNAVNDSPYIDPVPNVSIDEDSVEQFTRISGIVAGGGESQPLRITATSSNVALIPNPQVVYNSAEQSGQLTWSPVPDQYGTTIITVTVEDGGLDQNLATTGDNGIYSTSFTITINAVNDNPLIGAIGNVSVDEDASDQVTSVAGIMTGAVELQPLRIAAFSSNRTLVDTVQVTYSSPETLAQLHWRPIENSFGQTVITVTVEDGGLDQDLSTTADNGTAQRLFTITVNPVNDQPQIQDVSDKSVDEDAAQQTIFLTGINAGGSGAGIETQPLRITSTSSNPALIPQPQVNYSSGSPTGQLIWTPIANLFGESVITFEIEDGGLDQDINTIEDNARIRKSFTVTVNSVNDSPSFEVPSNRLVQAGSSFQTIDVTLISAGAFEQQPLTITAASDNPQLIADPIVVYSSPDDHGQLRWQPVPGQAGVANITVTLSDGLVSTSRVFTIVVNAAPTPQADRSETVGTKVVSIDVLANDTDRESVASQLQVSIVQPPDPSQGSVTIDAKRISFQAAVGFFGVTNFVYRVTDSDGGTADAIVEVGVARSAKQNPWNNLDVNRDTRVSPSDALQVINLLNDPTKSRLVESLDSPYDLDVNGDNRVSPADALKIINELNRRSGGEGETTEPTALSMTVDVVDYLVANFETHFRTTLQRVRRLR